MRNVHRALLASGLGFAVSCIAACGGGAGLLSGDQAGTLNNQLNQISAALAAGRCSAAETAAHRLLQEAASLPSTVDSRLRQDLDLGAETISQLAPKQCHPTSSQPTTSSTTTSTPTTTSTATTTTTPTTATPTTTTTTTTPATTPGTTGTTTGPSGGGGLGGGNGNGGNGGGPPGPPSGNNNG